METNEPIKLYVTNNNVTGTILVLNIWNELVCNFEEIDNRRYRPSLKCIAYNDVATFKAVSTLQARVRGLALSFAVFLC